MQNEPSAFSHVETSGSVAADDTAAPSTRTTRTVLAVDDDPIILMNTAALLDDLGYRVIEADCGQDALDALTQHPEIDLLITDHAMPGMTGSELIVAARLLRPTLPIILATGYSSKAIDASLGLTRLDKPYSFADLEHALALSEG